VVRFTISHGSVRDASRFLPFRSKAFSTMWVTG